MAAETTDFLALLFGTEPAAVKTEAEYTAAEVAYYAELAEAKAAKKAKYAKELAEAKAVIAAEAAEAEAYYAEVEKEFGGAVYVNYGIHGKGGLFS